MQLGFWVLQTPSKKALRPRSPLAEEQAPVRAPKKTKTYTGAVWVIAVTPVLQLAVSLLLLFVGLGHNLPLVLMVWFAPYLLVLGFAAYDKLVLQTWGHERPASALWAFLREPGYLLARALRTYKETGKGFAPIALWVGTIPVLLAAAVAMPGLAIAAFPEAFSGEVEQSVVGDAQALGAELSVECPAPPLFIGETFTCRAEKPNGETDSISVSLQRQNGWISWRVEDWGLWVLAN